MKNVSLVFGCLLLMSICVSTALAEDTDAIMETHTAWETYQPVTVKGNTSVDVINSERHDALMAQDVEAAKEYKLSRLDVILAEAQKNQDNAQIWNKLGIEYAKLKFYDYSEGAFTRANKIAADDCRIKNNLANISYVKREFKKAIRIYKESIAVCGENPKVMLNMSLAYYELGKISATLKYYNKAIEKDASLRNKKFEDLAARKNTGKGDTLAAEQGKIKFAPEWFDLTLTDTNSETNAAEGKTHK